MCSRESEKSQGAKIINIYTYTYINMYIPNYKAYDYK